MPHERARQLQMQRPEAARESSRRVSCKVGNGLQHRIRRRPLGTGPH